MFWLTIICLIVASGLVIWATSDKDTQTNKNPVVHLNQECPYKIEPPDNK